MEKQINVVFQAISGSVESEGASLKEKIRKIVHAMEQYMDQINELDECTIPTTPP